MATPPSNVDFLTSYPEFMGADASLVTVKLAEAARRVNGDIYQTAQLAADAVCLQAALLLLKSPYAYKMRLANPDQEFVWERELRRLQRSATLGLRVF